MKMIKHSTLLFAVTVASALSATFEGTSTQYYVARQVNCCYALLKQLVTTSYAPKQATLELAPKTLPTPRTILMPVIPSTKKLVTKKKRGQYLASTPHERGIICTNQCNSPLTPSLMIHKPSRSSRPAPKVKEGNLKRKSRLEKEQEEFFRKLNNR